MLLKMKDRYFVNFYIYKYIYSAKFAVHKLVQEVLFKTTILQQLIKNFAFYKNYLIT